MISPSNVARHWRPRRDDPEMAPWATWCGFQEDGKGGGFELWNLREAMGNHPAGSTVTRQTILNLVSKAA